MFVSRASDGRIMRTSTLRQAATDEWCPGAAPEPALSQVRVAGLRAIDAEAESVRLTYVTAGAGQAAEYRLTAEEAARARTALDAGEALAPADYPHLAAEVDAGGAADLPTAVAMVEAEQAAWTAVSAAIKQARRAGKLAVAAATTVEAVTTARDTALAALDALRAQ
jgi:hypothetical protein